MEEHFSAKRLAPILDCSVSEIRKAILRGDLKAVRIGRLVRIPTSSVQKWLLATRPARPEAHS